jgi:hypothetical protein
LPTKAKRKVQIARLGIALISFANATVALAVPKAVVRTCAAAPLAIEACNPGTAVKVQRPPRVPRREQFVHGEWRIANGE